MRERLLLIIFASGFSAACGISGLNCTEQIQPGVVVNVLDAATMTPIADSAFGAVHDGTYTDSLRHFGVDSNWVPISLAAADERPGVYTVDVFRPGYRPWSDTGVQVQRDGCHVATAALTASMQRL